ncbi:hypothetical protein JKP88DRAFT_243842 [Tribonema minus]|uniref:Uncharacterized protein n=1 Tax=Tribonema minus TaxID=303371 RepID=A0A836CJ96_9STRA|nr:hypothetical protein JKP88DRAFT_243842 [Tribonema minus]
MSTPNDEVVDLATSRTWQLSNCGLIDSQLAELVDAIGDSTFEGVTSINLTCNRLSLKSLATLRLLHDIFPNAYVDVRHNCMSKPEVRSSEGAGWRWLIYTLDTAEQLHEYILESRATSGGMRNSAACPHPRRQRTKVGETHLHDRAFAAAFQDSTIPTLPIVRDSAAAVAELKAGRPVALRIDIPAHLIDDAPAFVRYVERSTEHMQEAISRFVTHNKGSRKVREDVVKFQAALENFMRSESVPTWLRDRSSVPYWLQDVEIYFTGGHAMWAGLTAVHRHATPTAALSVLGPKQFLFAKSDPRSACNDDDVLAQAERSKSHGAKQWAAYSGPKFKVALSSENPNLPNLVLWPPGWHHEVHTPGKFIGAAFQVMPRSISSAVASSIRWLRAAESVDLGSCSRELMETCKRRKIDYHSSVDAWVRSLK